MQTLSLQKSPVTPFAPLPQQPGISKQPLPVKDPAKHFAALPGNGMLAVTLSEPYGFTCALAEEIKLGTPCLSASLRHDIDDIR